MIACGFNAVIASGIVIDGRLDDDEWEDTEVIQDFVTTSPLTLGTPQLATKARIFSNVDGIYIGITNLQRIELQQRTNHTRDAEAQADYNEIILDFDNKNLTAYGFRVANGGSIQDAVWTDEIRKNTDWDGDWVHATYSDESHWYVEIFIPWSVTVMKKVRTNERVVGIYIGRWVQVSRELYAYPAAYTERNTFISDFSRVTIQNFETSKLTTFPYFTFNRSLLRNSSKANAGVDVYWQPIQSSQLNFTINPDFGQVESDDLVVNFTEIESFFSEKRPFFNENHALFDIQGPENLRLVHTRRIGGEPDIGDKESTDILGAVRITRSGESLEIGGLVAVEDDTGAAEGRNFFSGRLRYSWDNFNFGYLLNYTDRPSLKREAWVHAIDFRFDPIDELQLTGLVIASQIDELGPNEDDWGAVFELEYSPIDEWSNALTFFHYGADLEVNDFGFVELTSRNQFTYETEYEISEVETVPLIRDMTLGVQVDAGKNDGGDTLPTAFDVIFESVFANTSSLEIELAAETTGIDDIISEGEGDVMLEDRFDAAIIYSSPPGYRFQYSIGWTAEQEGIDGYTNIFTLEPRIHVTEQISLEGEISYAHSSDWLVKTDDNPLATFSRQELDASLNLSATIRDKHELRLKLEWVGIKAKARQAFRPDSDGDLMEIPEALNNFELSEFAMQVRYRYELGPLTNIFVVYSRGGEIFEDSRNRSFSQLLSDGYDKSIGENLLFKIRFQF